jgi:hypothetical protein
MLDDRTLSSPPLSDVDQVAEHVSPEGSKQQANLNLSKADWPGRRKAKPTRVLLPRTVRWMETLPPDFQPRQTSETFPRIANALAALWSVPEELTSYLDDLLVDKREWRQGFPVRVLSELHALSAYNATFLTARELATSCELA